MPTDIIEPLTIADLIRMTGAKAKQDDSPVPRLPITESADAEGRFYPHFFHLLEVRHAHA